MLAANSTNPFADHIMGLLSGELLLLDTITDVVWQEGDEDQTDSSLLVRSVPPSETAYDAVKEMLVNLLRDDRPVSRFAYLCMGQVILDADRRRNLLLKLWVPQTANT